MDGGEHFAVAVDHRRCTDASPSLNSSRTQAYPSRRISRRRARNASGSTTVAGVNASSGVARKRSSAPGARPASITCPDGTACIGTREPVQSRTWTSWAVPDLVHVVDDPPVGNGKPCDLACGRSQLDEMRPRHPH